jgi:hypothetical protein
MCTVIVLRRPGADWPTLIAANRDERIDRPWDPPGRHWPGQDVIGGRDREAGGTWMAVNGAGVMAAVLNRPGSLGPAPGKQSRGELPLLALEAGSAAAAAERVAALDAGFWRPFHMVIADSAGAWFIAGLGEGRAEATPLAPGVSVVTAHPPNDVTSPRIARHLPRFAAAAAPAPPDWGAWTGLLGDSAGHRDEALNVAPLGGFGTVSGTLLGLGRAGARDWRFAPGPPDRTEFTPVICD